jgi:nicotinamide mononucleotide (NMN) deamidase PncC
VPAGNRAGRLRGDARGEGGVALAAAPSGTAVRRFLFAGGREQVKFQASQAALNTVRQLLSLEPW